MRRILIVVVCVVLGGATNLWAEPNTVQNPLEDAIHGIWKIIPAPRPSWAVGNERETSLRITESNYIIRYKEQAGFTGILDPTGTERFPWITDDDGVRYCIISHTYTLNTSTTPRQIDLTRISKDGTALISRGIYKLEGDDLWLCYGMPDKQRPTEFTKPPNDFTISLIHAIRVKTPARKATLTQADFIAPTFEQLFEQIPVLKAVANDREQYQRKTVFGANGTFDYGTIKSLDIQLWWGVRQGGWAIIAKTDSPVAMSSLRTIAESISGAFAVYLSDIQTAHDSSGVFGNLRVICESGTTIITTMTNDEYIACMERQKM